MVNFAGMERILACKMNYIVSHTDTDVYFSTYEQQGKSLPFPLAPPISYVPIDAIIPKREVMSFYKWFVAYIAFRYIFRVKIKQLLEKTSPDIVICTGYSFQVLDIIINESNRLGMKIIVESHTLGKTVTFSYKFAYNNKLEMLFRFWDKFIQRSLKTANCIVTLTKFDVPFWSAYNEKVKIIPNMLTIKSTIVKNYKSKRVISAGRYMPEKGFDRLIEAWSILQKSNHSLVDWQLYIYGNGDRTKYKSLVTKLGLDDSIHLEPATKDITEQFSNSSLYVMSSRYEGFGLVLTEAMSCGLPCISFDCPYGPRDVIRNGDDGILIEDGNITALAEAMEYMMSDEKLREKMGRKAIDNVSRYSRDNIMPQWISLFNSL